MLKGVDILADAVSVTMGPKVRKTIHSFWHYPRRLDYGIGYSAKPNLYLF